MSQTTITSGAGNNQDNNISAESDKISRIRQNRIQKKGLAGIVIVIILIFISLIGVLGAYFFYFASPQRAYVKLSEAIKNNDTKAFAQLVDCEKLKQNFLDGKANARNEINCNDFNLGESLGSTVETENQTSDLQEGTEDKYLVNNIIEAYTKDNFYKKGSTYRLEIPAEDDTSEFNATIAYVFEKVGGDWKITDIDLGSIEDFINAFSDFSDSLNQVDRELTANLQETIEGNGKNYEIITVDEVTELNGTDFFDEPVNIQTPEGKKIIRILTKREETNKEYFGFAEYSLQKREKPETLGFLTSLDEGYEDISNLQNNIPQEYKTLEEASQTIDPDSEFDFPMQTVFYEYYFFEVDAESQISDYQLLIEEKFVPDNEQGYSSFRVTIDL